MTCGEQSVLTTGTIMMPLLPVASLDIKAMVFTNELLYYLYMYITVKKSSDIILLLSIYIYTKNELASLAHSF